jgi:hypothetical protein
LGHHLPKRASTNALTVLHRKCSRGLANAIKRRPWHYCLSHLTRWERFLGSGSMIRESWNMVGPVFAARSLVVKPFSRRQWFVEQVQMLAPAIIVPSGSQLPPRFAHQPVLSAAHMDDLQLLDQSCLSSRPMRERNTEWTRCVWRQLLDLDFQPPGIQAPTPPNSSTCPTEPLLPLLPRQGPCTSD